MRLLLGALCAVVLSTSIHAQAPAEAALPPALKDWRGWVLHDLEYRTCPFLANKAPNAAEDYICAWPGRLNLASRADGATFSIHWRVETAGWVPLPGDGEHWPQQVTLNAQRVPVLARDDVPMLWLQPGSYEIAGRIPWSEQPQALNVPQRIGLITLSIDGKAVLPVQRDGDAITLGRAAAAAPEADSIDLRVYRKLSDGLPAQLTTRVLINVSGQAREEVIGPMLPAGFAPLALVSAWPARVDADGKLHVQVQPGANTVTLEARALAPLAAVAAQVPAAPWPKQEIWSYEAQPRLRVTAASSALQLDPRQAEVPPEWQMLPAFGMGDGAKLAIEERSRGMAPDEANRLNLQREAWLDFDGAGWTARDRVTGRMTKDWRLDVLAPYTLEQASALNSTRVAGGEPLLITRGTKPEASGVEWRTPGVDLLAGVRIAAPAALPVGGWQQTFDHVQATLHFPFGYKLLGAPGADSADGSWIARWALLDLFKCAIVVLLAWRLLGPLGALAAAVYLVLGYHEAERPLWSLLAVLAFALIARALPPGRLATTAIWLRRVSLALLILIGLPFVADQVRYALYPQLEQEGAYFAQTTEFAAQAAGGFAERRAYAPLGAPVPQEQPMAADVYESTPASAPAPQTLNAPPPPPMPKARAELKSERQKAANQETVVVTGSGVETVNPVVSIDRAQIQRAQIEHYSESTVVQTGRGMPNWTFGGTARLAWSGPVLATQSVRLLIAPQWLVRPLRLVLAALLAWVVWRVIRRDAAPRVGGSAKVATALLLGVAFGGVLAGGAAHAQGLPSEELLQQLRTRLTEAPKCAPACAGIAEAQVAANGDSVSVGLEVHAAERVAVPLPNDAAGAAIRSIQVDGSADEGMARDAEGGLWLALNRGVHRVQIEFSAHADQVALAFPLKPARVLFQGKGWESSGVEDARLLTETLTLTRAHDNATSTHSGGVQQFPPYVRVERDIALGLEWSASTTVQRLSPAQGGFTLDVPVLAGEHVASAGIKVQNGKVPVAIGDGAASMTWQSTLDKGDTLALTAPGLGERAEVWRVVVSPTWHVEFSGVPGVGADAGENANEFRNFEFHPLPGETLTLRVTRPVATQGAARAIDGVSLRSEAGQRAATHTLAFTLRASQGGDQAIGLPKDAELLGVSRDGQTLNVRLLEGKMSLPVAPGSHTFEVRFRDAEPIGTLARTPAIALGLPAANVWLDLQLPADRWLLAAFGPAVGPAVLYWGELIVLIALAFALARTRRTPLRFHHWLLLGLGFSTFSWSALLIVVAWLFAFDWRRRGALSSSWWRFNLTQVALAVLTVVALFALASAIPQGLAGQPDMHVVGNGSTAFDLRWFADRSADALPQASALSLPLWVYKVLMLGWALWLANAVIGWLREGFAAWTRDGYWRPRPAAAVLPAPTPTAPTATP